MRCFVVLNGFISACVGGFSGGVLGRVGHSVGKYVNPCTVHYIISRSCGVLVNGYLQPIEVTRIF